MTPPINQFTTDSYSVTGSSGSTYNWSISPISLGNITSGQGTNNIDVYWSLSGPVTISVVETNSDGCEGEMVDFSTSIIISSIEEESLVSKKLKKITDILGRETKQTKQPIFYIYDDGTVEKKLIIE